jgi:hypothetical protein
MRRMLRCHQNFGAHMTIKRHRVSNGLLIVQGAESWNTFNLKNLDVVLGADYDALAADKSDLLRVLGVADERIKTLEAENTSLYEHLHSVHHCNCNLTSPEKEVSP